MKIMEYNFSSYDLKLLEPPHAVGKCFSLISAAFFLIGKFIIVANWALPRFCV